MLGGIARRRASNKGLLDPLKMNVLQNGPCIEANHGDRPPLGKETLVVPMGPIFSLRKPPERFAIVNLFSRGIVRQLGESGLCRAVVIHYTSTPP